jgi:hypothetical protein
MDECEYKSHEVRKSLRADQDSAAAARTAAMTLILPLLIGGIRRESS